jgi:dsDNA-specific endonuclease/ATPase MutS2
MIAIRFEEREKIGLQYALETLHGCSPFGIEKIRRLRFYAPEEREELEDELYNVEQAARYGEEFKGVYDKICMLLCQMKEIRGTMRRIKNGDTPDHVELFELKNYLQRMETLIPLVQQVDEKAQFKNLAFHDTAAALAVLDPENTRSRGFYIPDSATQKLREIRQAKKQIEEQLYHAITDAEKDELRQRRTRICAEEDSEEMKVRKMMGANLAPLADDILEDIENVGRLDFLIQKARFALRYRGIRPEITDGELELIDMVNPELVDLLAEK